MKSFRPGGRFSVPIKVTSNADSVLTWTAARALSLSYRWYDEAGVCVVADGSRTRLPVPRLQPFETLDVEVTGEAPAAEGEFTLKVSLLLEGRHWACDVRSSAHCDVQVHLTPAIPWPTELTTSVGAKAIRGALAAAEMARRLKNRNFDMLTLDEGGTPLEIGGDGDHGEASSVAEGHLAMVAARRRDIDELLEFACAQERRIADLLRLVGQRDERIAELSRTVEQHQVAKANGLAERPVDAALPHQDLIVALAEMAARQDETLREVREGAAIKEMTNTLRQLATWSGTTSDIGLILPTHDKIEQVRQLLTLSLERHAEQRDEVNRQLAQTAGQLGKLTQRQAISLPRVGLVLLRNHFGLLAVQDDDPLAVGFYSSGDLPEAGTVAIVDRLLSRGDCFVDIGANVGIYSLIAAHRVGREGKVLAFEPTPSTQAALRMTMVVNGLSDLVSVYDFALGSEDGTATLHCEATSGHNSLLMSSNPAIDTVEVPVRRGDEILQGLKPTLLKIDVEGWEVEVLDGLKATIMANPDIALIVEYSPEHVRRAGLKPDEWLGRVRAGGLNLWLVDDDDLVLRRFDDSKPFPNETGNLFMARRLPDALRAMEVRA